MYSRCISRWRAPVLVAATVTFELSARGVTDDESADVGSPLGVGTMGELATSLALGVICENCGRMERAESTGLTGDTTRIRIRGRVIVGRGTLSRGRFGNLCGWY